VFVGFLVLGLVLLGALVSGWARSKPPLDTTGLEGTWRSPTYPRHTYQFRANGDVDVWYEGLPLDRFMAWQRDGAQITIRTTHNWNFVGELGAGEIRGTLIVHNETGATISTVNGLWRRE
jgi:hypothetical protein